LKKILLDENLPIKLKSQLQSFEVYTVYDKGWDSFKNGKLLQKAMEDEFDIFLTSDKNIEFQQDIAVINIAFIVLDIILLKWSHIEPLIPELRELIPLVEKGKLYKIK
jgi:predicted nuclease of predicted toxin-antitoxin system